MISFCQGLQVPLKLLTETQEQKTQTVLGGGQGSPLVQT